MLLWSFPTIQMTRAISASLVVPFDWYYVLSKIEMSSSTFTAEEKMRQPVTRWMSSLGLTVKAEFVTPWGMCDLVGSCPRKRNCSKRIRFGQRKAAEPKPRRKSLMSLVHPA